MEQYSAVKVGLFNYVESKAKCWNERERAIYVTLRHGADMYIYASHHRLPFYVNGELVFL